VKVTAAKMIIHERGFSRWVARPPIVKSTLVTSSRRVVLWPGSTKKPSRSRSTILKDIERDFYMTAQQALGYGIVEDYQEI
jgi:ATP-dependent protease ClpP protease subunit